MRAVMSKSGTVMPMYAPPVLLHPAKAFTSLGSSMTLHRNAAHLERAAASGRARDELGDDCAGS